VPERSAMLYLVLAGRNSNFGTRNCAFLRRRGTEYSVEAFGSGIPWREDRCSRASTCLLSY
jgi:hypothetical protein